MLGGHVGEGRNDGYQCNIYLSKSVSVRQVRISLLKKSDSALELHAYKDFADQRLFNRGKNGIMIVLLN